MEHKIRFKSLLLGAGAALILSAGAASAAVVTNPLNLRSGPGTGYPVIATMPAGAHVAILNCRSAWCQIDWRGAQGYASRSYLASGGGYAYTRPYYYEPDYAYGYYGGPYYDYGYGPSFSFGFGGYHHYHHHHHHFAGGVFPRHHHHHHHYRNATVGMGPSAGRFTSQHHFVGHHRMGGLHARGNVGAPHVSGTVGAGLGGTHGGLGGHHGGLGGHHGGGGGHHH
jgi:uncharacterized protein YraI